MNVVASTWAHRLIGDVKDDDCGAVDVEKDGVRALCVDCRVGFRKSQQGLTDPQVEVAALNDEWARQKAEEAEAKFPWSLRKAIEQLFDLELEAQEGIWLVEGDDARRAVSEAAIRPVLEATQKLRELYLKVTGFEFRTRRDVLNELVMKER